MVQNIRSKTGKKLEDIHMKSVLSGHIKPEDIKIAKETLQHQGELARKHGRWQMEQNFARAGELTALDDKLILDIYNKLRPNRSTKEELLQYASLLEDDFGAYQCAKMIREAAQVYEKRGILKTSN